MARGGEEGEYHLLIEPSPSYGRGRDGLGGWFSSLIGGSHLTDVVISELLKREFRNAGRVVPMDQPKATQSMLKRHPSTIAKVYGISVMRGRRSSVVVVVGYLQMCAESIC
nr:probable polygalacturonase [Tanacetum cinerariifolium]